MLYHHETTSWIIKEVATGAVVTEIFNKALLDKLNTEKYVAVPSHEHLFSLNQSNR